MNYRQQVGQFGERLAAQYLIRQGFEIVGRNVKTSYQEIDLIAKLKDLLVFVEVKTRTSTKFGQADEAVGPVKIANLKQAVQNYLYANNLAPLAIRVDLISVDIDKNKKTAKIKHYKDII